MVDLPTMLNMAVDLVRTMGLQTVIIASAVVGVAFMLYRRFFSNRGGD